MALLIWRFGRRSLDQGIQYGGLEYLVDHEISAAVGKRRLRALWLLLVTVILAAAWVRPELRTSRPLSFGSSFELSPIFLLALDVSASMTEPLGGYVVNGELNIDGVTRFDAARERIYDFIGDSKAKIGLILFSVRPMLVRWPTLYTEFGLKDILNEGMRFNNPARNRPSQLARFAGGTSTRAGLQMAKEVLKEQNGSSKSLILIADFIDDTVEVVEGLRDIDLDDTYIHILAVDPQPRNLEILNSAFSEEENIKIFPVTSAAEMDSVFSRIVSIEDKRRIRAGGRNYVQDIRWIICLAGFVASLLMILLFDTNLHKTDKLRVR